MGIKPPPKDTMTPRERERELDLKEKLALPSTNEKNQRVMHCQRIDQTDCHVT